MTALKIQLGFVKVWGESCLMVSLFSQDMCRLQCAALIPLVLLIPASGCVVSLSIAVLCAASVVQQQSACKSSNR